jgi:hypothetical protein
MRTAICVVIALGVVAAGPALASAKPVYAAPNGKVVGLCGSPSTACEIHRAVGVATHGGNVVLLPGSYNLNSSLSVLNAITIHGSPGHRPKILEHGAALVEIGNQAVMQDVEVDADPDGAGTAAVYAHDATLDRTIIRNAGGNGGGWAYALVVRGVSYVLDSLVLSPQGMALHVWNGTVTFRNDDMFGFAGMRAYYDPPNDPAPASSYPAGNVTVNIRNCILGASSLSFDGEVYGDAGSATVDIDFSNFRSIYQSPGGTLTAGQNNQTTAPTFVDAAGGDYREAGGSVTIDAGTADALGPRDLGGNIRTMGAGPDIGAFELVTKPTATTLAASAITSAGAKLNGSAHNGALGGTYRFQYGLTTKYGSLTPSRPLAASTSVQRVAALIGKLKPGTRYHFRLVVTNAAGTARGRDLSFVTAR